MKFKAITPVTHVPNMSHVALLTAYMDDKSEATFDAIEKDIPEFKGMKQGQIHQIVIDAGFEFERISE